MTEFVQGICGEMCPSSEVKSRTRQRLLHFFELKDDGKYTPHNVVKSFSRSAAGTVFSKKPNLRTRKALHKTVEYLLTVILNDKRKPFFFVYDFIFDRLRCVRQEIVIQNFNYKDSIDLLQPIILFLAYSSFRLCNETINHYDPQICEQHLQECLKRVLYNYDELDKNYVNYTVKHRSLFESLYQVFNCGSVESLERSFHIPKKICDETFILSQRLSLNFLNSYYYKVFKIVNQLPHILCAVAFTKVPKLRRRTFEIFSYAYNSKNLKIPIQWIQRLLFYDNTIDLISDCKLYGIEVTENNSFIKFSKMKFNKESSLGSLYQSKFVEDKLKAIDLTELFLLRKVQY